MDSYLSLDFSPITFLSFGMGATKVSGKDFVAKKSVPETFVAPNMKVTISHNLPQRTS